MARPMESTVKRPRISIDVRAEVRRRLRLAAAKRDVTVRQYVLAAIDERLREDLGDETEPLLALTAKADPVLAGVWDNAKDAAYDRLPRTIGPDARSSSSRSRATSADGSSAITFSMTGREQDCSSNPR